MNLAHPNGTSTGRAIVTVVSPISFGPDSQGRKQTLQTLEAEVRRQLQQRGSIACGRLTLDLPVLGPTVVKCHGVPFEAALTNIVVHIEEPAPSPQVSSEAGSYFSEHRWLPDPAFDPYWERIYLPDSDKERPAKVFLTRLSLAEKGVDSFRLAWSGVVLLEGLPGTGKTSLARGVAQQVALRSGKRVRFVQLDAHRLSDEMLGRGPKQIEEALRQVQQWAREGPTFVVFDEVETLMTCRRMASREGNPVDVFRSVNAAIQVLDEGLAMANLMVLCTSNLPENIDPAWLSRMDLQIHVGLPDAPHRQAILQDALASLEPLIGKISGQQIPAELVEATHGMAGRRLRKLILEALIELDNIDQATAVGLVEKALELARFENVKGVIPCESSAS